MKRPREYSPADIERMREAVTRLGNRSAAALELDLPRTTIVSYTRDLPGSNLGGGFNPIHAHRHPDRLERPGREPITVEPAGAAPEPVAEPPPEPQPTPLKWTEKGDEATATFISDRMIRTEADALAYAAIDTTVWYVKAMEVGGWTTNMKLRGGQDDKGRWSGDTGHTKQGWRISLSLARILPKPYREAADLIFDRQAAHAPAYPVFVRSKAKAPHLLEIDLFDVHFGKLAWRAETGQDYDLPIASMVFRNAVEDLASQARGFEIDRILLPIGNDFYHIDNLDSATTKGTRVDSDGRHAKIIETGEMAMINAIDYLVGIAPVDVVWIPGNHDRLSSFYLARTLSAWYRKCPEVSVDMGPMVRKYYRYHRNLIGLTHSDKEKIPKLPGLMADEAASDWGQVSRREFHVGHRHVQELTQFGSVAVRKLSSLSARDAWHFELGYASRRAAEAFIFSADGETAANFQVSAREAA